MSRLTSCHAILAVSLSCLACAGRVLGPGDGIVGLRVEPETVRVPAGETRAVTARFVHRSGAEMPAERVAWIATRPGVAVVDSTGTLTGVAPGVTKVVAAAAGYTASVSVRVPGWFQAAPLPLPRRAGHAAAVAGKLYFIAGFDGNYVATTYVYDPESDAWSGWRSAPTARAHGASAVWGDRIFLIGGVNPDAPVSDQERLYSNEAFDVSNGVWATLAPMTTARGGVRADTLGGRIYVVAGGVGRQYYGTVEVYDPASDTWDVAPLLPTPRISFAIGSIGGRLYVAGGHTMEGAATADLRIYDPKAGAWARGPDMPTARHSVASAVLDDRLVVIGGSSNDGLMGAVEVFDPRASRWLALRPLPVPRAEAQAVVLGGVVYVIGGATLHEYESDRVDGYVP
jgi:N-acetylneuraminic acid mutarotase